MNKLVTFASVALLSSAAAQVNAAIYDVSGSFNTPTTLSASLGGPNILTGGGVTLGGTVETDTSAPGYSVTGGTVTLNGTATTAPTGDVVTLDFIGLSGTASSNGVLFDSGTVCVTGATACDLGNIDVSVTNLPFLGGLTWGGFFTTAGIQLEGGAGGSSFTVTQPGSLADVPPFTTAVGAASLLGNDAGVFFGGDITFTEQTSVVPIPAAAWLFGSALLGLVGVGRRRRQG